ncbi:MAG: amino acid ABC transporter permease [Ardenticatenaceae bacterium]|nr:amino acid ABC transporter permease [Ardenticatenaceae bacterium]
MTVQSDSLEDAPLTSTPKIRPDQFPFWLVIIIAFLGGMAYLVFTGEEYRQAFDFIWGNFGTLEGFEAQGLEGIIGRGLTMTLYITLTGFFFASIIGLFVGLGRISRNLVLRTLATTYIEFIRGVPTVVLIFTLALVVVPAVATFFGVENSVSNVSRAIAALAIIYGAYMAEVFRAGIESVPRGQTEAARSLGMTSYQAMRNIILPQAIRNIMPALGNDFIAILKDSSLVTLLAVRDLTQQAKLYSGSSFRFRETYLVLTFLYLAMTITLSLILRWYENRIRIEER